MVIVEPQAEQGGVRRHRRSTWMSAVPLLSIIVLAYVAFAAGGADFNLPRFSPVLPSGGAWQITLGDGLLALALFVLFFEILKSTRTGGKFGGRSCALLDRLRHLPDPVLDLAVGGDLGVLFDHAHDPDRRDRRLLGDHPRGKAGL
ncbi:MAG: hypothetical protein ACXWJ4_05440 [Methyloceanibacter sp.]